MATLPQMTLLDLRTAVRQRADMVNSQFVTDPELNTYINGSMYELYDLLIQKYSDNYYIVAALVTTAGGSSQYALPSDFYKLVAVDLQLNATADSWVTLRPFTMAERNRYMAPNYLSVYGRTNLRYKLNGPNLWLTPQPTAGQTVRIWYVPRLAPLASDSDIADGFSGWLDYVVVDAAIKCKDKEESDVSVLIAHKQALTQRIEAAAENRDAGSPATVADSASNEYGNGFPGGGNY